MAKKKTTDGRANNGGHSNAGRKPATDPKIPVQFYVETSIVENAGGIESAREIGKKAVVKAGRKKINVQIEK